MPSGNPVSSVSEEFLKELEHYGPVTAIKVHKSLIIVGYGPILKIFNRDGNDELIFSQKIFKRNKIHSIAVNNDRIAIAGARSFAVLEPLKQGYAVQERAINEWIVAVEFLNNDKILVLTSHNEVLEIDIADCENFRMLSKYHCNEKSILYSGSIRVINDNVVYVSAGTVMDGVLIWDLRRKEILHNLRDHEGSIFGVKIDASGKFIISCSDDRSVKLYSFDGTLLASGWGHGSRIWSLEFLSVSDQSVKIFSCGEDCAVRLWEYHGEHTLRQLMLFDHYHSGKHIWSGDVDTNSGIFVTGGADGKVRAEALKEEPTMTISLEEIAAQAEVDVLTKELIRSFGILNLPGITLVVTTKGRLFLHHENVGIWSRLSIDSLAEHEIAHYTLFKTVCELNAFIVCNNDGDMHVIGFDSKCQVYHVARKNPLPGPKKIINMLVSSSTGHGRVFVLLNSPILSEPMDLVTFVKTGDRLEPDLSQCLQKTDPRTFIPTSFHVDWKNHLVFVGSRHANFAVYEITPEQTLLPKVSKKLCNGDTITSLSLVDGEEGRSIVLVTLRDGFYILMETCIGHKLQSKIILKNKISRNIEGGFMKSNQLILYGFRSSCFYLWNETKQIEIAKDFCKGGHRHWEVSVHINPLQLHFSYLTQGCLRISTLESSWNSINQGLLVEGTHGREIRDVALHQESENSACCLFVSASEDARIKVGKLYKDGKMSYQWTMNNHISGLQRVAFLNGDFLASSAANEELLIWKLTRLRNEIVVINEVNRVQVAGEHPDLRVMDFASKETSSGFWIAAAYSNSIVKIFFFNKKDLQLQEKACIPYGSVCILNIHLLSFGTQDFVMTGTSDGNLIIWDLSSLIQCNLAPPHEPIVKQQVHQSGVKAVLPFFNEFGAYTVVTGGDDNSLISSQVSYESGKLELVTTAFVERAASATIVSISRAADNQVLVTSVDQIVRVWDTRLLSLNCICAKYTTVADTGCSDTTIIDGRRVGVVAGAGVSVFTWDDTKSFMSSF